MTDKRAAYRTKLKPLLLSALDSGDVAALEQVMVNEGLPSKQMMNLAMANGFADAIGEVINKHKNHQALVHLLDQWAVLSPDSAPVDSERIILPTSAVLAYGQIAVSSTERWTEMVDRLHIAAFDSRWRVREIVSMSFQRMLAADWRRTIQILNDWITDNDPLVIRAIVAAVAELPLLKTSSPAKDALNLQSGAVQWLLAVPQTERSSEAVRVLRQALGFTISVIVAALPDEGFAFLQTLAANQDKDIQWILRENLKKNRLAKWPDKLDAVRGLMG